MTSTSAAPDLGGTGSVLAIWSLLIVVIGSALFAYSVVVTLRGRRSRRRRRRPQGGPVNPGYPGGARPLPPSPASRPLALPAGPTAGGKPVDRHLGMPRPRALPAGPAPRQLALPAAGQRYPSPPPPAALPMAGAPPALPEGPTVGTGYAGSGYGAAPYPQPYLQPHSPPYSQPPPQPEPQPLPAAPPSPTMYGTPTSGAPVVAGEHAVAAISATPAPYAAAPSAYESPTARVGQLPPPREEYRRDQKPPRRARRDECATLRAECEQLREVATAAAAAAAQAATEASAAHTDFLSAQRTADEARRAHDAVVREAAEVAAQIASLERVPSDDQERLQAETSHAAFAAYRRGDISSEQLREVFRRAEGWTPEHDRLSRHTNELRAQEAETVRVRDAAVQAEQAAGERARAVAISARALDDEARTAALDARGRCAAADACEQRRRR